MDARSVLKTAKSDASRLVINPRFIGPCMAGIFCLVVATVVGINYLFMMATTLLVLPIASYLIGYLILRHCKSTRVPQMVMVQGERAPVSLQLTDLASLLHRDLSVRDRLPRHIQLDSEPEITSCDDSRLEAKFWIRAMKRGKYIIGPADMIVSDPLAMLRMKRRLQETTDLVVYPKPIKFSIDKLCGGRSYGSGTASGRLGASGDFAGVREYRSGDELRRVHWKSTARTQRLVVKELDQPSDGSISIVLDLSAGSELGTGSLTSIDAIAGLATYALKELLASGRYVRLILPEKESVRSLGLYGLSDLPDALEALAQAEAESSLSLLDAIRALDDPALAVITASPKTDLAQAVHEAITRRTFITTVIVDPALFGAQVEASKMAMELERSGAQVVLIRELQQ